MLDYNIIVATVKDANADPVLLAKIAYEHPEFGANVAANPRAYPGLKRWLAQFGNDRARETLKQMGFTTWSDPVHDQLQRDAGTATPAVEVSSEQHNGQLTATPEPESATDAAAAAVPEAAIGVKAEPTPYVEQLRDSHQPKPAVADYQQPTQTDYQKPKPALADYQQPTETQTDYQQPKPALADYQKPTQTDSHQPNPTDYQQSTETQTDYQKPTQTDYQKPKPTDYQQSTETQTDYQKPNPTQTGAASSNPYGFTADQALDPGTDQVTLAQIARYAPELRPCLARNPNTYPALLNWLAQLHDPAIDAVLENRPR